MGRILPSEMESYEQRCRNANAWSALSHLYSTICKDGKETVPTLMGADIHDRFEELNDKFKKAEADYQALCEENQKSDINKLISDYCAKNDIAPPSPYFSDKACVEYLFSVVDLERKHREAVGKQMVDNYEKDLLKFIYKEYANRTHLSDETITYNPPSIRNTVTKIIRDYVRSRTRVDILETRIKSIFDKGKTKFTVDDYVTDDPTTMFMLDCISSWIGSSTNEKSDWYGISPYIKQKAEEHGISMRECKSDDWRFVIGFLMGIIARMKEKNGERRTPYELK